MAVTRIHTGTDGKSHFQDIEPKFVPRGDQSEVAELVPGSGIVIPRFEPTRTNPWHHAPAHVAVFTLRVGLRAARPAELKRSTERIFTTHADSLP
jgi:hypothetical protein